VESGERIEECSASHAGEFDLVTARAVGSFESTPPAMLRCLGAEGEVCLWLTESEADGQWRQSAVSRNVVKWFDRIILSPSRDREI
jgi:16S rRNA G527 N7-methylase RsmG